MQKKKGAMTDIYYKPVSNRVKEKDFFYALTQKIGRFYHFKESYQLPNSMINQFLDIDLLKDKLQVKKILTNKKKEMLLQVLDNLPKEIKVADNISRVSVDFTLKENDNVTFLEFHEKQHRNISDSRLKPIYTPDNKRIEIPRYAQRFLKDVWRVQNLKNYKIIWWDWFENNKNFDLKANRKEYFLKGKFSFTELLK